MRRAALVFLLAACHREKPPAQLPPLPHAAYAHYLEGKLASYRDDWKTAAAALAEAAADAPDQPMVAVALARAQAKAKHAAEARATLTRARAKWPSHPEVWLASGDLLAKTAPLEASRAYRKAIDLEPTEERAYLGLARLAQTPAAALAVLRELVARVPTSIDGRYRLGQRLARARDLPGALAQFRKVLELDPDHIDARLDLARGLRIQGHLTEAIAQTRSAFDRSGQALDLAEELYYLLIEADDRVAVIDLLTLLDDDRSDTDALVTVARFDRGLGRFAQARAVAARIAKTDSALAALVDAETDIATGDPAAGAKRALAIEPDSDRFVAARRVAATALLAAGDPKAALEATKPARKRKPKNVELATLAAFALVDLHRVDDAKRELAHLGDGVSATFARARVADRAGDAAGAIALCEGLLRAKPDLSAALNLAGYLLADSNQRLGVAERYLRRARELSPGDPAVLDSWGWLLYRQHRSRAAVRVLDHAARYAPAEPEIQLHLAAAWLADGAPRTAAATLDRAAALHPSPAVANKIAALRARLRSVIPAVIR